ncbi:MAG: UbiX family flavin prenyltransferase [Actinomycetota bacterium]|nr:UbiX family flavin prenyltransferase [Actinomycetota bacterium]
MSGTSAGAAPRKPWVVGITGASGAIYARRLLQTLLADSHDVDLIVSNSARVVLRDEEKADVDDMTWRSDLRRWLGVDDALLERVVWWRSDDMAAGPSSGSYPTRGLLVVPCSMGTLAAVAGGGSSNLVQRAASVSLKEVRPTVLLFREAPLNRIHLTNLLAAHDAGCRIVPAAPGFYHQPTDLMQLVDFIVGRVLDAVGVHHDLYQRWRAQG